MLTNNPDQVYHIMPVLLKSNNRNVFMKFLDDYSIECGIHYPIPIHKMPFFLGSDKPSRAEDYADRMVSLPIHPFLSDAEIELLTNHLNKYEANYE